MTESATSTSDVYVIAMDDEGAITYYLCPDRETFEAAKVAEATNDEGLMEFIYDQPCDTWPQFHTIKDLQKSLNGREITDELKGYFY